MKTKEIEKFIKDFHSEMEKGLKGAKSSLMMIPTFVDRPTGMEKGHYLALDLGGTNFRVLFLDIAGGGKERRQKAAKYRLKKEHISGDGKKLFGFIARCIKAFIKKEKLENEKLNIGFTFSFPVKQIDIDSGKLIVWTKGFKAKGVEGKDVVELLNASLIDEGLTNVKVVALANDTVGTLTARAYSDKACDVGVIVGTGTNACYREKIQAIKKLKGRDSSGSMIINIEWGNFNKLERNVYDKILDRNSINPGRQHLEKMISGMYLGELARIAIKGMIDKGELKRMNGPIFKKPYGFNCEMMQELEADNTKDLRKIDAFLKKNGIKYSFKEDRAVIQDIMKLVTTRAATLSALAVIAVVTKMDPGLKKEHTVAIDGSIFEKYYNFRQRMNVFLKEYLGNRSKNIKVVLAKDGSGKGAAVIAAVAAKI